MSFLFSYSHFFVQFLLLSLNLNKLLAQPTYPYLPPHLRHVHRSINISSGNIQIPPCPAYYLRPDQVLFSASLQEPNVSWMRVVFDIKDTFINEDVGIRIRSKLDNYTQLFWTMTSLKQWQGVSAYFNGDAVEVAMVTSSKVPAKSKKCASVMNGTVISPASVVQLSVVELITSVHKQQLRIQKSLKWTKKEMITSSEDKRTLSHLRPVARMLPLQCTAFIIDDQNHCFLSSGHCANPISKLVLQFGVPKSTLEGELRHPRPKYQFSVDRSSMQYSSENIDSPPGRDWMYFGVFPNPMTGKTAFQTQKQAFHLFKGTQESLVASLHAPSMSAPKGFNGTWLEVPGYGNSANATLVRVQQTHTGHFLRVELNDEEQPTLLYDTDTDEGNSGSPVIDVSQQLVVAIHNGRSMEEEPYNYGTLVTHPHVQQALKNPKGTCLGSYKIDSRK